jgi:hypothetical protein
MVRLRARLGARLRARLRARLSYPQRTTRRRGFAT